ncbi:MAG: T9SS type A sorting domain-containing protein [Bacteroidetes bacterium]|nr:T9SS type A sorting domain-containing protein [Bacteroidota bacterium]
MKNVFTVFLFSTLCFSLVAFGQTLNVTPGTSVLDGVVSPGEWTSAPLVTNVGVTLNAMADGQYLYVSASWVDGTENIQKNEWSFDGSAWSKSGNEDRVAFIWDMGLNGSDGASCATMCHGDGFMSTNNGTVDVWHWKAARGNALGFTDDKYFNNVLGGDGGRHGDPGTSAYSDNADDGSGFPSFMASGDPGANTSFLAKDAATLAAFDPFDIISPHKYAEAVAFDNGAAFSSGDVIPGYVLRNPAGDRASVQSAGKYENGVWTVEFRRPYTGSDYDFEVVPGSSVEFTHEIFDNTGSGHPNDGMDATLYTLDFSVITDVDDQLFTDIPNSFELNQNYPNPFNPSTIISFSLPMEGITTLKIYDVLGREIITLVDEFKNAGVYTYEFNAGNLSSGIYIYSLQSSDIRMTKKNVTN